MYLQLGNIVMTSWLIFTYDEGSLDQCKVVQIIIISRKDCFNVDEETDQDDIHRRTSLMQVKKPNTDDSQGGLWYLVCSYSRCLRNCKYTLVFTVGGQQNKDSET